jgi:hypothetical protein
MELKLTKAIIFLRLPVLFINYAVIVESITDYRATRAAKEDMLFAPQLL